MEPAKTLTASGGGTIGRIEPLLDAPGPAGVGTTLGSNAAAVAAPVPMLATPNLTTAGFACC